jgi:hypothetical protein
VRARRRNAGRLVKGAGIGLGASVGLLGAYIVLELTAR